MPGTPVALGPWVGGLHDAAGTGEGLEDDELFSMVNLELDTDKSLVNRPAITTFGITGVAGIPGAQMRLIGTYLPDDGRKFIVAVVPSLSTVHIINADTGASVTNRNIIAAACVQYKNRLWIIPQTAGTGGYFDVPTSSTITFTTVAAIPVGVSAVIYKERCFVTNGLVGTTNTSRFQYSEIADFTLWPGANNVDIVPGNGQRLVSMLVTAQDIYMFKEHSTYKYGYANDPARADITLVSDKIGVPATNCALAYNNNTIYVLHDNAVYELYGGVYTKISTNLAMAQEIDADLFAEDTFGLTLYRSRLFVRYYAKMYVFNLDLQRWSSWETAKKFSRLVVIPNSSVGLDTAYAGSASSALPGRVFIFRDDRVTGVGTAEVFNCSIIGKLHDFAVPTYYKRLFMGGLQIATSGTTTITSTVPNAAQGATWDDWKAQYTWDTILSQGVKWDSTGDIVLTETILPAQGLFARKVLKCLGKMRFRQIQFTITTEAKANTVANASVRIYDLTLYLSQAETIVKETS